MNCKKKLSPLESLLYNTQLPILSCKTKSGNFGNSDSSSVALRSFCAEKSSKGTLSPSDSTSANDISRAFLKDLYARSSKPKL